jgi:hypothetical protein
VVVVEVVVVEVDVVVFLVDELVIAELFVVEVVAVTLAVFEVNVEVELEGIEVSVSVVEMVVKVSTRAVFSEINNSGAEEVISGTVGCATNVENSSNCVASTIAIVGADVSVMLKLAKKNTLARNKLRIMCLHGAFGSIESTRFPYSVVLVLFW